MNNTFKADIDKVFFTDFADKINLSGVSLKAVITKIQSDPKITGKFKEGLDATTLIRSGLKVSIKTRDFPSSTSVDVGDRVKINGISYYIYNIEKRYGMLHLYIQKYEG